MRTENAEKEHNIFSAPANANIQCNAKNMEKLKTSVVINLPGSSTSSHSQYPNHQIVVEEKVGEEIEVSECCNRT